MSDNPSIVAMSLTACKHDKVRVAVDPYHNTWVIECMFCDQFWDADMHLDGAGEYTRREDE